MWSIKSGEIVHWKVSLFAFFNLIFFFKYFLVATPGQILFSLKTTVNAVVENGTIFLLWFLQDVVGISFFPVGQLLRY